MHTLILINYDFDFATSAGIKWNVLCHSLPQCVKLCVCMSRLPPPAPYFILLFLWYPSFFICSLSLGDFQATVHLTQFGLLFEYFCHLIKIHIFVKQMNHCPAVLSCGLNAHMVSQIVHHEPFELVSINFNIKLTRQK